MKPTAERDVVKACLAWLTLRGVLAWRNQTMGTYDAAAGRYRKFTGLKGVSDVLMVLPGGRFGAVECKYGKGRLSEDQQRFIDAVNAAGGFAVVAYSLDELIEKMKGVV